MAGFNAAGATPGYTPLPSNAFGGSTPFAKALGGSSPFPALPPAPQASSQGIASQVHTDAAGNSVKTTFQPSNAQTAGLLTSSLPKTMSQSSTTPAPIAQGLSVDSGGSVQNTPQTPTQPSTQTPAPINATNQPTQPIQQPTQTQSNGSFTTPSGAVVGADGKIVSQPPSFSGTVGSLVNSSQAGSAPASQATQGLLQAPGQNQALGQNANAITQKYSGLIAPILRGTIGQETGDLTTGTQQVGEGNAAVAANAGGQLIQGLTNQENQELSGNAQGITAQSQAQTGLNEAGGVANTQQTNLQSGLYNAGALSQPVQVPYNNQFVSPITGQPVGGGSTGQLPQQAQDFVNSLATQVQNGQMTRNEATSQLSAYGQAGLQALNSALGSGFNTNASNASAATTATGQALQTQQTAANAALDTLATQFSSLGAFTGGTGFQPANSIEQSIAGLFGNSAVSQYTTTLQEARAKISGVLAASGGVTPTTADEMAKTYLPDGMTPSQLPAKISAAKNLIQQSVDAFTKSGNQNSQNNTSSNSGSPTGKITTPYGTIDPTL